MIALTPFRRNKKSWKRVSGTAYATGFSALQLIGAFLWGPYMRKIMPQAGPARTMLIWFRWLFVQIALFALLLRITSDLTGLEIALQIFQDNTTIGWGNSAPATWLRFLVELPMAIWGIALFGLLITAFIDLKVYTSEQRRAGGMPNPNDDGIVIINFPGIDRAHELITQLRAGESDIPICFTDETLDQLPPSIRLLKNIDFVRCSAVNKRDLEEGARVQAQRTVIVYPKDITSSDTDATTETTVKRIWKLGGKPHIIYYLVSNENRDLFEFDPQISRRRPAGQLLHAATLLAAQEALNPGFGSVMQRLIRQDSGATPELVKIPESHDGIAWHELGDIVKRKAIAADIAMNHIALIRGDETDECPKQTLVLQTGDIVLLSVGKCSQFGGLFGYTSRSLKNYGAGFMPAL